MGFRVSTGFNRLFGRFQQSWHLRAEAPSPRQAWRRFGAWLASGSRLLAKPVGSRVGSARHFQRAFGAKPLALEIREMAALSMEQRALWVQYFMQETGVPKFTNCVGILTFFSKDDDFSGTGSWASFADAGILQAFQDGWRLYQGLEPVGYIHPTTGLDEDAGAGWCEFFRLHAAQDPQAEPQWGRAEQAGVNYGLRIAQPYYEAADSDLQYKIDRLLWWSDIYRGVKARGWDRTLPGRLTFAPFMSADNKASELFVQIVGELLITAGHEIYRNHRDGLRAIPLEALFSQEAAMLSWLRDLLNPWSAAGVDRPH